MEKVTNFITQSKRMFRSNDVIFFENEKYVDVNLAHSVFPDIYTESCETKSVINENNETFYYENISEEESETQDILQTNGRPQRVCRV